ncbi:uncharacterized protein BDZ99DRAFT_468806 [Mytilinidion resinicola]|uniref:RING-type domain-containing protein n=1 Tax=Mytilinidion resinicola TaxID=574789 RepID=A0A6A6Y1T2_9PEZI|nr:uncharacterized protein BDZ99DRAFT_468806 [Mytilinidion resinicola]KAF2802599.1 hypothetical protein BDZ99DRAFT_468806 [Mytilinidion resinicola]
MPRYRPPPTVEQFWDTYVYHLPTTPLSIQKILRGRRKHCPICLKPFSARHQCVLVDTFTKSFKCHHFIGRACLRNALKKDNHCPICRTTLHAPSWREWWEGVKYDLHPRVLCGDLRRTWRRLTREERIFISCILSNVFLASILVVQLLSLRRDSLAILAVVILMAVAFAIALCQTPHLRRKDGRWVADMLHACSVLFLYVWVVVRMPKYLAHGTALRVWGLRLWEMR